MQSCTICCATSCGGPFSDDQIAFGVYPRFSDFAVRRFPLSMLGLRACGHESRTTSVRKTDHGVGQECSSISEAPSNQPHLPTRQISSLAPSCMYCDFRHGLIGGPKPAVRQGPSIRCPHVRRQGHDQRLGCSHLLEGGEGHTTDVNASVYRNAVRYTDGG